VRPPHHPHGYGFHGHRGFFFPPRLPSPLRVVLLLVVLQYPSLPSPPPPRLPPPRHHCLQEALRGIPRAHSSGAHAAHGRRGRPTLKARSSTAYTAPTGSYSSLGFRAALGPTSRPHRDMMHVAGVHFKCFRCLEVCFKCFHTDVAKIDRDVAHVAMVVHVCFKCLSPMFICFFRRILQVRLSGCCIYFTHMLKVFQLHVFQVFHLSSLYVANVASGCFKSRSGVAHEMPMGSGWVRERSPHGQRSGGSGPAWVRVTQTWSSNVRAARAHVWTRAK
jgi:hypothetical protein